MIDTARASSARTIATVLLVGAAASTALPAGSAARGRSARAQSVKDYARLRLASSDGNTLFERGVASGALPGPVEVRLTLGERTASSSFTIHARGGTISGHGQGELKAGRGGYESFGGSVLVTGGTGRFRGAHGKGGLYGSIYRVDDSLSVQVIGKLYY